MHNEASDSFGARLRSLRLSRALTQEELAERAGLSANGVSALERGIRKPMKSTLRMLVEALALDADERSALEASTRDPSPAARLAPSRLPADVSSFVGRVREVADVLGLLANPDIRLLTLTGAGGTGKTRLALRVARHIEAEEQNPRQELAGAVAFVPLAVIDDPRLVPFSIADALRMETSTSTPLTDLVIERIGSDHLLLILDNFEHLLDAAPVIAQLLSQCPNLKVLATSRSVLRLSGEYEYSVPPLGAPEDGLAVTPDGAARFDAVSLFTQRATAVRGDFVLNAETTPAVIEICRKLDNLPLAIELATSRLRHLSPAELLSRLQGVRAGTDLDLLAAGPRDAPDRHRTLRRTIDWSYALLPPESARLFARLAIFPAGCTLEGAEQVCGETSASGTLDVIDSLATLVESSLVRREDFDRPRYTMLQAVRAYAAERLQVTGEEDLLWDRLADYLIRLAETAEPELVGPDADLWLERLAAEHDTTRAVLRRLLNQNERTRALRLGGALARFWQRRGHYLEGYAWLTEALEGFEVEGASRVHARAMHGAGSLAATCGDFSSATVWFSRALEIWEALDDTALVAGSLNNLAVIAQEQGDYDRARSLYEDVLPLHRQVNDLRGIACALNNLGIVELESGDPARAAELYEEALPYFRQTGWDHGMAAALTNLAILARRSGDLDRSECLARDALALHRRMGDPKGIATALSTLGNASMDRSDLEPARAYYEEAITLAINAGDREIPISALEDLATVAHRLGDHVRAAQLLGAAEALSLEICHPINPAAVPAHETLVASLRQALGPACFETAWAEGRRMDLHEAVERAMSRPG